MSRSTLADDVEEVRMEYVLGAIEYVIVAIGVLLIGPCVLAVVLGPLVQRRERPSARTVPGPGAGSAARP